MTIIQYYFCPAQRPKFHCNRPAHRALPECPYGQSATGSSMENVWKQKSFLKAFRIDYQAELALSSMSVDFPSMWRRCCPQQYIMHEIWKSCMKFGHLILRKIIKFVATRCQILRLMHQNRFRLGLRPRSRWGAYSAPPDSLAGLKGPTSKAVSYTHLTLPTKRIV